MINWFTFGQEVVIYFIMQQLLKKSSKKPTLFTHKRGDLHSAILFILSTGTGITLLTKSSNIAGTTIHFVVKSSFLVCLLTKRFITMANTDVIHVIVNYVIFVRFIVLRLTKTATRSLCCQQTCALY